MILGEAASESATKKTKRTMNLMTRFGKVSIGK